MTAAREWIPGRLVGAALAVPERASRIGPAIWLYLYLLVEVGHQGRLCRQVGGVAADLGVPDTEVDTWLASLSEAGLVTVLSPSPFLVIKLPLWSGNAPQSAANPPSISGQSGEVHMEVPVSSSSAAAAASSNLGVDGGRGEGEGLLRDALATLDEADPEDLRQLLGQYPVEVIRRALRRVQATPPAQIRKSKTALFRYLLAKLS